MLLHYTPHTQFPSPSMLPSVEQSVHCDQQPSPTTRKIKRARHPQVINKEFTTYTHLSSSSHQQLSTVWLVTHSTEHLCITLWERVGYGVTYQWCTSIFISTINIKLPCNMSCELVISVGPTTSPYIPIHITQIQKRKIHFCGLILNCKNCQNRLSSKLSSPMLSEKRLECSMSVSWN